MVKNQKPYSNEDWHKKKVQQKLNKIFFSILDSKLNDKFYSKKIRLNPSNEALIAEFMTTLKKWRSSATLEAIATEFIPLDARYKYDRLNDMTKLLDVVNKREMVSYL